MVLNKAPAQPPPEFSRPIDIKRLPALGAHEKLKATAAECEGLARRMNIPAIHALAADLHARPWRGGGVKVKGTLNTEIEQVSVISLELFRQRLSVPVERYYLPKAPEAEDDDSIDVISGDYIDLGELVAETLALELDPYPRKPGESFVSAAADVPEKAHAFDRLKDLTQGKNKGK